MPLQFREVIARKIQQRKKLLDKIPSTGSVQNYVERYRVFSAGLKSLQDELNEEAAKQLAFEDETNVENPSRKSELLAITKEAIHHYVKYFKGSYSI